MPPPQFLVSDAKQSRWGLAGWPPSCLLGGFLALHVLVWWWLPALLQHNLPLDVIEQLAWGHEWQMVYFKHPPLPAWIVESVAVASGRWPPALYLIGPLLYAVAQKDAAQG